MLVVEPGRGAHRDEELGSVRVGARVRHAHGVRSTSCILYTLVDNE